MTTQPNNPNFGQQAPFGQPGGPGGVGGPPKSVKLLKTLGIVVVALQVVGLVAGFLLRPPASVAGASGNSTAGGIVGILIGVGVLGLAFGVEKRSNVCRIVLGVLAVLYALFSAFGVLGAVILLATAAGFAIVTGILVVVGLVIAILIAINAFKAETGAWTTN